MNWDDDIELRPEHLREWVEGSGIDPEIAKRNLVSLDGEAAIETLCGDRLDSAGGHGQQYATKPVAKLLNRYEHAADGGWWCSPLITNDSWVTSSTWGCFKPDTPRVNDEGKPIKYEHPLDQQCGVFWLRNKNDAFWPWVLSKPGTLTIVITEGAKKAAALLTAGIPAVALSGIWNGTPLIEPKGDPKGARRLHPDLLPLIKHRVVIAFDYSSNNKGKSAVKAAAHRLAHYLYAKGCPWVGSATCPGPDHKGVDDILVHEGADALHQLIASAVQIDLPKEQEQVSRIRDLEAAAALYIDSERPAERADIRARTCSVMQISRTDFMDLVTGEIERRNPLQSLESKSLSLDEIAAQKIEKPRPFIHQLIVERQSTLIGGNRGATKSLLALTALVNLCSEQQGSVIGLPCEQSNVRALYVCSDMRVERIDQYLHEMGRSNDPVLKRNLRVWGLSLTTRGWDIRDLDGLQREINEHQPHIVVIDSLKAAMGHLLEDISKPIVRHYMDAVHAVVLRSAACLWIHHANKSGTIADNEALQEAPDMVYLLSKDDNEVCHLKPIKCRNGKGIRAQYIFDGDFLDLTPVEQKPRVDMGQVLSDVLSYIRTQNKAGIKPAINLVCAGLAHKGHAAENIKSCIRRNSGKDGCIQKHKNPDDLRQALLTADEESIQF
ncbi:MAG: Uncharacterised protein [Synechococcus sp. MIT S9220]|nr:MAG: Uncharacterised protein [Synechococcus sp. MIT S9220]